MEQHNEYFSTHSTKIRGVEYITFSVFDGDTAIDEHIGKLIENTYLTSDLDEMKP